MKNENSIGVWMDHSTARLINPEGVFVKEIKSNLTAHLHEAGQGADGIQLGNHRSTNNEYQKHERESNELQGYYKNLAEELATYEDIYLFGPTTARKEFTNFIADQKHIAGKKVVSESSDYISEHQIAARVKEHFGK